MAYNAKVDGEKWDRLNKEIEEQKIIKEMEIPAYIKEELDHFKLSRVPRCQVCRKDMVNARDTITKKISPYMWRTICGHSSKLRLMIG